VIQASIAGTVVFTVVSVIEVVVLSWTRPVAVAVDLVLFVLGCTAFLVSYAIAIGRSRTEEIGVASLYLLTNKVAPRPVRVRLLGAFVVQCVVAITAASVRPFTTAAFSVLVPMYGLGLNGLWAARHGTFGPRVVPAAREDAAASSPAPDAAGAPSNSTDAPADADIEQNARHG
jgi:hypothetical protein